MVNNDLGTTRKIVRISREGQILITTGMRTGKATNCFSEEERKEGGAEQGNLCSKVAFLEVFGITVNITQPKDMSIKQGKVVKIHVLQFGEM